MLYDKEATDLGPAQLHVGGVDLAAQQLVERGIASQDDGLVRALDAPVAMQPLVSGNLKN